MYHSRNGFLTAVGLREAAQRRDFPPEVDAMEVPLYLDSRVSVSGLELERDFHVFDDFLIDEQDRRFHHGW